MKALVFLQLHTISFQYMMSCIMICINSNIKAGPDTFLRPGYHSAIVANLPGKKGFVSANAPAINTKEQLGSCTIRTRDALGRQPYLGCPIV